MASALALAGGACRDEPTGPAGQPPPPPFANAAAYAAFVGATGIVLVPGEFVQLTGTAVDTTAGFRSYLSWPAPRFDPWPDSVRVAFSSSDPAVATVSGAGLVNARGAGRATIWFRVEGGLDSATVFVTAQPGRLSAIRSLVAAGMTTCALDVAGAAWCWGGDFTGTVGRGVSRIWTDAESAEPVMGGVTFASLSASADHVCGLTSRGATYCWGYDMWGQLGLGTDYHDYEADSNLFVDPFGRTTPSLVTAAPPFAQLAAGGFVTCGRTATGVAYCWGSNVLGAVGSGTRGGSYLAPTLVTGGIAFASLAAGPLHVCGLDAQGAAYCWGSNDRGQLGHEPTYDPACPNGSCDAQPTAVTGSHTFTALFLGPMYTCALDDGGAAWCWGDSPGRTATDSLATPRPLATALRFTTLAAGGDHACGLTPSGEVYCWGTNELGQLGTGWHDQQVVVHPEPQLVAGGHTFTAVAANGSHTCAVASDGGVWCWGANLNGQLGNGRAQDPRTGIILFTDVPTPVLRP
jgi:alpha-tubulin suppressor-like RCC1 family protein